ncbi:PRC-barrel domain-containing protein [Gelidibacter maritimus]|uniref:PRC-barrel domain-containing protein n=1 Tax=Gelidibacter maritimus TaxID=2761487 RepID=A0A7W2M7L9_9FLAO|nr:PRC-barrel domain-containing protein [Gelidibacter maritimus]MBA6154216.1 PRC-barrel domain-containing protein [Gelidibacter maritimus]
MAEQNKHLYYIDELSDYKIADGYPDIRGWDVKDIDHRVVGKVDNLLVNKDAERVLYLDVEVDKSIIDAKYDPYGRPVQMEVREFVNKDGENHIIIPIGLVDLNDDSNYVYTDLIDHRTFAETKRYRKGDTINRAYENQVLDSYQRRQREDADRSGLHLYKDENRLREIIRDEIRRYHFETDKDATYKTAQAHSRSKNIDDNAIIVDDELELSQRRSNDDVYDGDKYYERAEFDDKRFKKRTPGL